MDKEIEYEVKDLFDPIVKQEIISRIHKLTPDAQRQWGKMTVGQMLAHLQMPLGVSIGVHKISWSLKGYLFGRLARKALYDDKPFKHGLSTDPSFVMTGKKDFTSEKVKLLEMINRFKEENIIATAHPFLGKLSKEQWSKGMWKHLDHHLRQFNV